MIALKLLAVLASLTILISLPVYMWLALRGHSRTIYTVTFAMQELGLVQWVFLISAFTGFLLFFYNGAYALLFWLPDDLGAYNEGEFQSYREGFSALFATISFMFIPLISATIGDKFHTQETDRLPELISAYRANDTQKLKQLKNEFSEHLKLASQVLQSQHQYINSLSLEKLQCHIYSSLIDQTDFFANKLESEQSIKNDLSLDAGHEWGEDVLGKTITSLCVQKKIDEPGYRIELNFEFPRETTLYLESKALCVRIVVAFLVTDHQGAQRVKNDTLYESV